MMNDDSELLHFPDDIETPGFLAKTTKRRGRKPGTTVSKKKQTGTLANILVPVLLLGTVLLPDDIAPYFPSEDEALGILVPLDKILEKYIDVKVLADDTLMNAALMIMGIVVYGNRIRKHIASQRKQRTDKDETIVSTEPLRDTQHQYTTTNDDTSGKEASATNIANGQPVIPQSLVDLLQADYIGRIG